MEHLEIPAFSGSYPPELATNIEESLIAFCNITGVPVTFFDKNGIIRWEYLSENRICNFFSIYKEAESLCTRNLVSSINLASHLGEPYIFVCRSGLIKIAVSLIIDGTSAGCFMAGPLAMGSVKESTIANLFNLNNLSLEVYPKLIVFLRNMKTFQPKEVSYLAMLLNNCILSSVVTHQDYTKLNHQYKEQTKIAWDLQQYKKEKKEMSYPYDLENQLIQLVKSGDSNRAQEVLHNLMNKISLVEAGDLSFIRTKVLGLCAILSRVASERDPSMQEFADLNMGDINVLNDAESFQELSVATAKLVDHFSQNISAGIYSGNSHVIRQAVQYINRNYMNKISLASTATALHINQSYLSMLFKQQMEVTFTDYLNNLRVNRGKDLLSDTNLSLVDISLHTGFEDQSYFTKVFKKIEGVTPKQYRKLHQQKFMKS